MELMQNYELGVNCEPTIAYSGAELQLLVGV
jgi:hypothetical protein